MASDMTLDTQARSNTERAEAKTVRRNWEQWVDKNAKPKKIQIPIRKKRKISRWQKCGPMTRRDWVHFYKWAAKNALPKKISPQKEMIETDREKWQRPIKQKSFESLMKRIEKLSCPKYYRDPYQSEDPEKDLTFNPVIVWNESPRRDRYRPFVPVKLPRDFQHIELELDFWYQARFPVKPGALKYKATANIKKLAIPKVIYIDTLHCPYPLPVPEYIEPRRRFTTTEWKQHLRRLEYLARPIYRPYLDYNY